MAWIRLDLFSFFLGVATPVLGAGCTEYCALHSECTDGGCPVCGSAWADAQCMSCNSVPSEADCTINTGGICVWTGTVCDAVVDVPEFPLGFWTMISAALMAMGLVSYRRYRKVV